MRMTNKIMQNNSLYNINNNKKLQNKLSTQMSTNKKLTRPSDDPVIAIRALRLRSDVAQLSQFADKNAPDAESWLKVTSDALGTSTQVLKNMLELSTTGSKESIKYEDLDIIVTQLKSLRDEYYATGNVDYAGRYVFTGFRTDTTLTHTEATKQLFSITEQLKAGTAIDTINYTNIGDLSGLTKENYDPTTTVIPEQNITNNDIYRIRLSYDDLKSGKPVVQKEIKPATVPPTMQDLINPADIETRSTTGTPNPYQYSIDNPGKAVYVPETGELLIGKTLYDTNIKTLSADDDIRVTFEKEDWKKGDMRPQHYFPCSTTEKGATINYNYAKDGTTEYIPSTRLQQNMEYDVGYNQKIQINTEAADAFTMQLDRNVDDLEKALASLKEIESSKKNLQKMLEGAAEPEYSNIRKSLDAAEKAQTHIRDNMQKKFEGMIGKTQTIMGDATIAMTENGTRGSRLDLISNRLANQKTTFKTLQSENEDADVTEVVIQLTSMNFSYQSALMATGKIMQNSLMNFI